jgi:hypothetical protein
MGREAGRRLTVQPGNVGLGAGVNYLTGPGINNTDLWLQKTFQMTEHKSLQLRADAFNTFNHTQFKWLQHKLELQSAQQSDGDQPVPQSGWHDQQLERLWNGQWGARSADYAIGDEIRVLTGASET